MINSYVPKELLEKHQVLEKLLAFQKFLRDINAELHTNQLKYNKYPSKTNKEEFVSGLAQFLFSKSKSTPVCILFLLLLLQLFNYLNSIFIDFVFI